MTMRDTIAADLAVTLFDTSADETPSETVTYTTADGETVTNNVIVTWASEEPERVEGVETGRTGVRIATVHVPASAVASPEIDAVINRTLTSEDWTVMEVDPIGQGAAFTLTMKRSEVNERSRVDYRIPMGSR